MTYDIVVVGSGHNGLTTAAYLAKAGKKVLVLERNDYTGGGAVTQEMTVPGFWHDRHSSIHLMIQGNPLVREDELGLFSKYGLEYKYADYPAAMFGTAFDDGRVLLTYKDIDKSADEIAKFSARDAEAYRKFSALAIRLLPVVSASFYTPPPSLGASVALLDQSMEGRELLRIMLMSAKDLVEEWFENDYVKIHLLKFVSEQLHMPDEGGTGIGIMMFLAMSHAYGISRPVGGSGKMSDAMTACIKDHGGDVLLKQEVTGFDIRNNRVVGVVTADGEKYAAKDAVVGSIHPHILRKFFPDVDAGVLERAERVKLSPFSVFMVHAALNEPMKWRSGAEIEKAYFIEACRTDIVEFYKDFDRLKYGEMPPKFSTMAVMAQSVHDPVRAPAGKGVLYAACFANYKLRNGEDWDAVKERIGAQMIGDLGDWISNLTPENIIFRRFESPLDSERDTPSFQKGDTHGCGAYFYQLSGHRPTPDLAQYRVPGIDGFYLVGPFMHPVGGICGAGRGTAMKMLSDMKIDFSKVIGVRR
jgi:phytoene dehydrogenase-like protein